MKKVLAMLAVGALLFTAANSYACGNKSSAETSKASATNTDAKVKTADASCPVGACPAGCKQGMDAKASSASSESCPYMKDAKAQHADVKKTDSGSCSSMKDASAQKAGASGCCQGSKAATTKASSVSNDTKSKDEMVSKDNKDESPVLLIASPAQGASSK